MADTGNRDTEHPETGRKSRAETETADRSYVTALARGLSVMRAFSDQLDRLTLSDVARLVDLPRATVRRCLLTLESLGYVQSAGRYFSLSPQVLILAQAYLSSSPMTRVAQGFLERVSDTLDESCSASILHSDEVIYVARSTRKRIGSLHRDVGSHLPAYCTSMGRVLLAALSEDELAAYFKRVKMPAHTRFTVTDETELRAILERVRRQGYCTVDQELEFDLRSVAVPIRNAAGKIVAALNIGAQASKVSRKDLLETYLPVLRDAALKMRPLLIG